MLTDAVMPRVNGKELADRVKGLCPGQRVLFMSGYAEDARAPGEAAPGADFISKPFITTALLEKIRAVLSSPSGSR